MIKNENDEYIIPILWPKNRFISGTVQNIAYNFIVTIVICALVFIFLASLCFLFIIPYRATVAIFESNHEGARNYLLSLGALLGVPFLIWRTFISSNQAQTGRESLYTQLFTTGIERPSADKTIKATEKKPIYTEKCHDTAENRCIAVELKDPDGNIIYETKTTETTVPNMEVRFGAVYALERVALDSKRDANSIMHTLCAYVRNTISADRESPTKIASRPDIESAIGVISRFKNADKSDLSLNLKSINLDDAQIDEINFSNSNVSNSTGGRFRTIKSIFKETIFRKVKWNESKCVHCDFANALINDSSFIGSYIIRCNLDRTEFRDVKLQRSHFLASNILMVKFSKVELENSFFQECTIDSTIFTSTNLSSCTIKNGIIGDCKFFECDLSFFKMTDIDCNNVSFERCNLFGAELPRDLKVDLSKNFPPNEDYIKELLGRNSHPYNLALDVQLAWEKWLSAN